MRMTGERSRTLFRAAVLGVAAALTLAAGSAAAQAVQPAAAAAAPAATAKPLWKELSKPQQLALDPLRGEWDQMDLPRKQKWLEIANRYASMKHDEQQRVHERMRDWLKLTPEERRVARENYTLSQKIDKGEKSAQWEQYQQLPEEEKRKLAAEAALKKHATKLPKTPPTAVAPNKPSTKSVVCALGMVKNTNPAGPACIPSAATVPPATPAPATPPALVPPLTTPPPGTPAAPFPNAK